MEMESNKQSNNTTCKQYRFQNSQEELDGFRKDPDLLKTVLSQHYGGLEKAKNHSANNPKFKTADGTISIFTGRTGDALFANYSENPNPDKKAQYKVSSVVDFVQEKKGLNLGQTRKYLRELQGSSGYIEVRAASKKEKQIEPCPQLQRHYVDKYCVPITFDNPSQYLHDRGISYAVQDRFSRLGNVKGTPGILQDQKWHNAIFPLYNKQGLCGLEKRNYEFGGLNQGSVKGLWFSGERDNPEVIFFTESPIDGMSFYELEVHSGRIHKNYLFISISGQMNDEQKENVVGALNKYPDAKIIAGFDNDKQGEGFCEFLEEKAAGRDFERQVSKHKDWNDDLCEYMGSGKFAKEAREEEMEAKLS